MDIRDSKADSRGNVRRRKRIISSEDDDESVRISLSTYFM